MMSRLQAKRHLARLYASLRGADAGEPHVLLYHSIGSGPASMSVDQFRAQVRLIAGTCEIRDLEEVLAAPANCGRRIVAITFDDGYQSVRQKALPVLTEHAAPATVYLNTGWISDSEARLSRV